MNKKIALFRGINVGGRRKVIMKDLVLLFEHLGYQNVKSYIQSGNILFVSQSDDVILENNIEIAFEKKFRFSVPVIVRSQKEIITMPKKNSFYSDTIDIQKLHLTMLKDFAQADDLEKIGSLNFKPDDFRIIGKNIFIYCEGKYHQSKLSNNFFEKKLNVKATTRNWKTIEKLIKL